MRITESFFVEAAPAAVFDYMTDPSKLAEWQTSKTSVEQLTEGPPRRGTRVRERTRPPGRREFEQVVEFTEFDRPRRFHVHVVEGPFPIDGTWSFEPADGGTRVDFCAEGELPRGLRLLGPVVERIVARQFAGYHRTLSGNVAGR